MNRTRRAFLRDAGLGTAGLAVAFHLPACSAKKFGGPNDLEPNAALRITPEGEVIFTLARVEMGQGTLTSETMMIAEELNMDPARIRIEHAPASSAFADPDFGVQITGGSNSTRTSWSVLRQAGATAREALIGAAAAAWGIAPSDVVLADGELSSGERKAGMGEMATAARDFVSSRAQPKPRSEWKVIGTDRRRLDARAKTDGTARFTADVAVEGLEIGAVRRGPLGSKPVSIDKSAAEKMPGVKAIFEISTGVAVVADRTHRAFRAAEALQIEWSGSTFSTEAMWNEYASILDGGKGAVARSEGDVDSALSGDDVLEAEYKLPFLAHATMEPQVAIASVERERCRIWAPTQAPMQCALAAQRVTGLSVDQIEVHQTLLGGGFGRRGEVDFVVEAVEMSKVRGKPVRVMWTRPDDLQNDFYRPASLHRLRGKLSGKAPVAWRHDIVQETALQRPVGLMLKEAMPGFVAGVASWAMSTFANDPTIVEGAEKLPYAIDHLEVTYHKRPAVVPVGFWRSVGHSSNGFVVESFIDELAHAAGEDPVAFRRKLLRKHPRHLGVLELAAQKAGWGQPLPPGRARGVAVHESFRSYVAEIAEVSVDQGQIRVHKVVAAVDCGTAVHPDGVRAQIESGIVFGLSTALTQQAITFENGQVQQSNFDDFQALRMNQCPDIEVHVVESTEDPTGVGEPGTPPIAAAVGNAVFALTGHRLRELPFRLT